MNPTVEALHGSGLSPIGGAGPRSRWESGSDLLFGLLPMAILEVDERKVKRTAEIRPVGAVR